MKTARTFRRSYHLLLRHPQQSTTYLLPSLHPCPPIPRPSSTQPHLHSRGRSYSSSSTQPPSPSKPIVLEKPDKFRPPSHSQRLVRGAKGSRGGSYNAGGGAYNQSSTAREREAQKTKRYPHMFPSEGTFMHWFLTNRLIHLWITLSTLFFLATYSLLTTFSQTSPYAHLLPPLSTLPSHPINYFRESWAVFRLHLDYTTEMTAESRAQGILDAQKRRIYRRANGMEDLDREEDQGVDVRGLVPWDDGLTNKERERGGRGGPVLKGNEVLMVGQERRTVDMSGVWQGGGKDGGKEAVRAEVGVPDQPADIPPQGEKRKRKLWLGIW